MLKLLVLFSGTRSFEKEFEPNWECRGLDIDNKFKPFYLTDILKWDYKNALSNWIPDYVHASPVCSKFSKLTNYDIDSKEVKEAIKLLDKSIEIIKFLLTKNPQLKFTIENPQGKMCKLPQLKSIPYTVTSYCQYGYYYQKITYFWNNFNLKLLSPCSKKSLCSSAQSNQGRHLVVVGHWPKHSNQIIDWKYWTKLRKQKEYKGYTDTEFRYRIPCELIQSIKQQVQ